jgi:PAS domain S-box-containing protein
MAVAAPDRQEERAPVSAGLLLDDLYCRLYSMTADGADGADLYRLICRRVAQTLGLPLVLFLKRQSSGAITIEGTSAETVLWADFQRVPERWDGTVAGNGPAACALHTGKSAVMKTTEDGFMPWRLAAERDRIHSAAAWVLKLPDGDFVLELYSGTADYFQDPAVRERLDRMQMRLRDVLLQLAQLRQDRLLARALESAGSPAFLTDLNGTIVWCNDAFYRFYRYDRSQVLGRNPRFLQSGQQGMRYYRNLWSTIRAGRVWRGETVDRDSDGHAHTVIQTISPVSVDDRVTHYLAMHDNVSHDKERQGRHELRVETDERSGLLTRTAFEQHVNRHLEGTDASATFLLVTMRKFHQAAAEQGLDLEDRVVAEVGERIREVVTLPHEAGALGAGEYGLLFHGDVTKSDIAGIAAKLERRLQRAYPPFDGETAISVRTALAEAPRQGRTFHELHRHADRAFADEPLRPARRKRRPS